MSEKKEVNNEEKVVKEALRKEYLKEISRQLNEKAGIGEAIIVDNEGKLFFSLQIDNPNVLAGLIRYLAIELADTKAQLWLKDYRKSETN